MSCFDSQDELLYLLELTVKSLQLNDDKIHEYGDNSLVVKIKFLSMPSYVISQDDFESVKTIKWLTETPPKGNLDTSCGISCLFNKRPRDLVGEMQKKPLRIGVFCIGDTYPIAEAILPFTGCLCDQIAMALNDHDHMPEPYILQGCFGLLDPGENPSGHINFRLQITCLGKHVITHYQMKKDSFVIKRDHDATEYSVKRYAPSISDETIDQQKLDDEISESSTKSNSTRNDQIEADSSDESPRKPRRKKKKKKRSST